MLSVGDIAPPLDGQPVFGLPVALGAAQRHPVAVCFVRHLGSPFCRAALAQLQARYAEFDVVGAQVLVITTSPFEVATDFVPRHHLLFPVLCDPDRVHFEAWGVGIDRALVGTARSLALGGLPELAEGLKHGQGRLDGDPRQLPAWFVVGPGGRVRFARLGAAVTEGPPIDAMLEAVCSA
ncbi:AhpC/TSA family protein [Myxococcota bacterium]|nr:AhpC/TSA family protein [Myxococcota bacterium]